jgi:subtilisin family serine protease
MKRLYVLCIAALMATACIILFQSTATARNHHKFKRSERPIPNSYIVVLRDDVTDLTGRDVGNISDALTGRYSGTVKNIYRDALKGYSVEMTPETAETLSRHKWVKYVEEDSEILEQATTQAPATWGISRIDHRRFMWPLDQNYTYSATGLGVNVYVIDTGVLTTHPDFEGRATEPFSIDYTPIENCNGHGTHVAGTIGSKTYGVAKNVNIHSIRVFPCSGGTALSNVLAGLDFVVRQAIRPAVANLSIGTSYSTAFEDAVQIMIDSGITAVVAAGNESENACSHSPAHLPDALTVGSLTASDQRDSMSNYGSCVDIFAPGVAIMSTWNRPDLPANLLSGTSTASPHVAGAAALYLETHRWASPTEVNSLIAASATRGAIQNVGDGSPNRLLYSLLPNGINPCEAGTSIASNGRAAPSDVNLRHFPCSPTLED